VDQQCLHPEELATNRSAPEQFNPEWGRDQSNRLPDDIEAVYGKLLDQAQAAANSERFASAIATITGIPKNSRHHELAQRLQEDWSREILRQASNHYQQAHVAIALSLLNAIPSTSQAHAHAAALHAEWQRYGTWLNRAITAKTNGNWQDAIDALKQLENTPLYQSLAVQELLQQAITKLYEPDQAMMQLATMDLPEVNLSVPPSAMPEQSALAQ
jgi:hypothetical protein